MPAFPFIVQEVEAPFRGIVLQGRSLPYRGTTWGGEQGLDINWFVANPVASVQVLGPREDPVEIVGKWKDVFLYEDSNKATLYNFPRLGRAAVADPDQAGGSTFTSSEGVVTQYAQRARALRDAFRLLRKSGVLCRIEWGSLVRFGFVQRTVFPHDREEDIDYTITFAITGDQEAQPKVLERPSVEVLSLLEQMFQAIEALLDTLRRATFVAQTWVRRVNQSIIRLGSLVTEIIKSLEALASFAFAPADTFGTLKSQLTAIRLSVIDLFETLKDGASAVVEASLLENPALMALNNALQQQVRLNAAKLAAQAAKNEALLEDQSFNELSGVVVMSGTQTLRDIARDATGNPQDWVAIAGFNGFASSILPRGTVVRIPRL